MTTAFTLKIPTVIYFEAALTIKPHPPILQR